MPHSNLAVASLPIAFAALGVHQNYWVQAKPHSDAVKGPDNAKKLRLDHTLTLPLSKHHPAAVSHSSKETKMLKHVRAFSSIFHELYPQRRELFITPKNEAGFPKLVCTNIRPTQLAQLSVNT